MQENQPPASQGLGRTISAVALIVTAVLSIAVVLHHPVVQKVASPTEVARAVSAIATMDRWVHGALMVLYGAQVAAFYGFTTRLPASRSAAWMGLAAFAAAAMVMIIPATLDGFVTPDLATVCLATSSCAQEGSTLRLVAICIQDFTKVALSLISIATLLWSAAVAARSTGLGLGVGLVGAVCGLAPLAVIWFSNLHLAPGNLAVIILAQGVWNIAAATFMLVEGRRCRRRRGEKQRRSGLRVFLDPLLPK